MKLHSVEKRMESEYRTDQQDGTASEVHLYCLGKVSCKTVCGLNPFIPEFLKWTLPSLYLIIPIVDNRFFFLNIVFFFLFGFYGPFKNISLISSRSFIKGGRKPENPEKNHLTIRKQNLAFLHLIRARLEPQR